MFSITATDLQRFMSCNGVIAMDTFESSIVDNEVKDEGNAAHWLAQMIHASGTSGVEFLHQKAPNGVFITPEMLENVTPYIKGIGRGGQIECVTSFRSPQGKWEVKSRADHIKYEPNTYTLYVDDFKYGWGLVEVEMNWTLIAHALGWVIEHPTIRVDRIVFTIYQPRPHHFDGPIRAWETDFIKLQNLYRRLDAVLSAPDGMLHTGPQCKDCPAAVNCPALRAATFNALDVSEMAFNDQLDNVTLSYMLDHMRRAAEILKQSLKAHEELAMHRVSKGEIVENYSLEQGETNRMWKGYITPEVALLVTGKDLTKKDQMITPKQAETMGVPEEIVALLCERRTKGAKLVRIEANAKAEKMFKKGKKS